MGDRLRERDIEEYGKGREEEEWGKKKEWGRNGRREVVVNGLIEG